MTSTTSAIAPDLTKTDTDVDNETVMQPLIGPLRMLSDVDEPTFDLDDIAPPSTTKPTAE